MSKQRKKGRFERLQRLPEPARELLNEKVAELEEVVQEERNTILVGAAIFVVGLVLGATIASKREK